MEALIKEFLYHARSWFNLVSILSMDSPHVAAQTSIVREKLHRVLERLAIIAPQLRTGCNLITIERLASILEECTKTLDDQFMQECSVPILAFMAVRVKDHILSRQFLQSMRERGHELVARKLLVHRSANASSAQQDELSDWEMELSTFFMALYETIFKRLEKMATRPRASTDSQRGTVATRVAVTVSDTALISCVHELRAAIAKTLRESANWLNSTLAGQTSDMEMIELGTEVITSASQTLNLRATGVSQRAQETQLELMIEPPMLLSRLMIQFCLDLRKFQGKDAQEVERTKRMLLSLASYAEEGENQNLLQACELLFMLRAPDNTEAREYWTKRLARRISPSDAGGPNAITTDNLPAVQPDLERILIALVLLYGITDGMTPKQ